MLGINLPIWTRSWVTFTLACATPLADTSFVEVHPALGFAPDEELLISAVETVVLIVVEEGVQADVACLIFGWLARDGTPVVMIVASAAGSWRRAGRRRRSGLSYWPSRREG